MVVGVVGVVVVAVVPIVRAVETVAPGGQLVPGIGSCSTTVMPVPGWMCAQRVRLLLRLLLFGPLSALLLWVVVG